MASVGFFSKPGSSRSNTTTQTANSHIWADRAGSSSASAGAAQSFRPSQTVQQERNQDEYTSFLSQTQAQQQYGPQTPPFLESTLESSSVNAVGPHSLISTREEVTSSHDIQFQESIDGMEVVAMLEVMDTQAIDLEGFEAGLDTGRREIKGNEEETEDPVEWLGTTRGEYNDEVWGDVDLSGKGRGKVVEEEEVVVEVKRDKGKGVARGEGMKSRL